MTVAKRSGTNGKSRMPGVIPEKGVDKDALLAEIDRMCGDDADWRSGKTWSLVYHASDAHQAFLKQAHNKLFSENGLNPMAFGSLKRMESEVVRMTASMLNGDEKAVGTMTTGGTESILLAVKAYRDRARWRKPWVRRPEMVIPRSAHVAFEKASHYFGVKIRYAPMGEDYRADVKAMRKLVNRNTILLVASAPQYVEGVVDPIAEIGQLAQTKKIPLHVDSCIGGYILPWIERLGRPVPLWDFRVPGVTSISADVHKYGYAAKGASTVIYRDMSYLKHQFFISTDWPGGIYASPSMLGTRAGGSIAAAWAAMMALGEDGYIELTKKTLDGVDRLRAGIGAIPELGVLGDPHSSLVSFESLDPTVDLYAVADLMEEQGWNNDRQQNPASIHCTVSASNAGAVEPYLADLKVAVARVKADPTIKSQGNAAMYGMMAKIPFRRLVKYSVLKIMEGMYGPDGEIPDLSKIGQGKDDDFLFKLINDYGEPIMKALDRVDELRQRYFRR